MRWQATIILIHLHKGWADLIPQHTRPLHPCLDRRLPAHLIRQSGRYDPVVVVQIRDLILEVHDHLAVFGMKREPRELQECGTGIKRQFPLVEIRDQVREHRLFTLAVS